MIQGDRTSGYFVTYEGDGIKVEGETRMCVHCQYTWEYKRGSGIERGWCMRCNGITCQRDECAAEQRRITGNRSDCMTIEEFNERQRDQYLKSGQYEELPSGILVAKS